MKRHRCEHPVTKNFLKNYRNIVRMNFSREIREVAALKGHAYFGLRTDVAS